jgi:hypothetical protein
MVTLNESIDAMAPSPERDAVVAFFGFENKKHYVYYKGKAFPNQMSCFKHVDAQARLNSLILLGEYPVGSTLDEPNTKVRKRNAR